MLKIFESFDPMGLKHWSEVRGAPNQSGNHITRVISDRLATRPWKEHQSNCIWLWGGQPEATLFEFCPSWHLKYDPSNPPWKNMEVFRIISWLLWSYNVKKKRDILWFTHRNEKKDLSEVGFEPTPPFGDQKSHVIGRYNLESGALDHSAILTTWKESAI